VHTLRGRARAVRQRELDRICQLLRAVPTMRLTDGTGRGRVARAVPDTMKALATAGTWFLIGIGSHQEPSGMK
jgi:hypothetical protein